MFNKLASMSSLVLDSYMSMLNKLDVESRLTILSALTDSIRTSLKQETTDKRKLLFELYGAWDDLDESVIDDIYENRSIPEREVSFD